MDKEQLLTALNTVGMVSSGGGMNWGNLIGSMVFGMIGFVALMYGWKQKAHKPLVIGIALSIYPFFVPNTILMYLIGTALTAALYFWRD